MHSTCARVRLDRSHATDRISPSDPFETFTTALQGEPLPRKADDTSRAIGR
jgi:hypothetical protein